MSPIGGVSPKKPDKAEPDNATLLREARCGNVESAEKLAAALKITSIGLLLDAVCGGDKVTPALFDTCEDALWNARTIEGLRNARLG